jgi:2',3'-cyclic-nucleotide 2'-phosphodiesterase (5'-nucleotidase family)
MVDGKNMCVSLKVQGVNTRMLVLNGKTYMVLPDRLLYCEVPEDTASDLDFSNLDYGSNQTFKGSRYVTENGKTYTVDSYKKADGTTNDYYFLNGKWVRIVDEPGTKNEDTQEITEFKSGVTASYFSLSGLIKFTYPSD